jgi:hypothetical protein
MAKARQTIFMKATGNAYKAVPEVWKKARTWEI